VKVLDIDRERQRISLGLKQTQEDPWQRIVDTYNVGDELEGRVTKVVTFGAFVEILDGVEGLVHISELAPHHVESPREIVHPGDEIRVKILEIDSERRRLSLSAKRVEDQVLPIARAADAPAQEEQAETEEAGRADGAATAEDAEVQAVLAQDEPTGSEPDAPQGTAQADADPATDESPQDTAQADADPATKESPQGTAQADADPATDESPQGTAQAEEGPATDESPQGTAAGKADDEEESGGPEARAGESADEPSQSIGEDAPAQGNGGSPQQRAEPQVEPSQD
jgi:small subunit ribosomal protein S1